MAVGLKKMLRLNSGYMMPALGLGTFQLLPGRHEEIIDYALHLGYRHIDTAFTYHNEECIGQVVKDQIKAGKLKRRELFITTKVPAVYLALKDIKPSVESSLEKLKLNFVDMVLIHYPFGLKNLGDGTLYPLDEKGQRLYENYNLHDSWRGLEQTVNAGLVRSIGLSNFTPSQIQNICKRCFIKPANLQLECHAYLQQKELRKMCYSLGIVLSAYGPLGNPGRPESYRKSDEIEQELINDKTVASVEDRGQRTEDLNISDLTGQRTIHNTH